MVLLGFLFCFYASCLYDFFVCLLAYFGLFSFMGECNRDEGGIWGVGSEQNWGT